MLDTASVVPYLVDRGVLDAAEGASVAELGGGVSCVVLAVERGDRSLVVKQALPRLRVADEWLAKRERAVTEAAALELAGRLVPDGVPRVLDVDPQACALVVERAPAGWVDWKRRLLDGVADRAVASRLGGALALIHGGTLEALDPVFDDAEAFDQLRVDPYYRTAAARNPGLAAVVEGHAERMSANRRCLVHGDFSPKNVLVGNGRAWVVDWEVAHRGDPAFDLAFMLNHLALKTVHRPGARGSYHACGGAFAGAYGSGPGLEHGWPYVLGHVGCLMLARVDGKSPAEYLDEDGRARAKTAALRLLAEPPDGVDGLWEALP